MYKEGDYIIYGFQGVCRVDRVGKPDISGVSPNLLYYTLSPIYSSGTIFIPVDTSIFMRPVMKKHEVMELIRKMPEVVGDEMANDSYRVIEDAYKKRLSTHECLDLVRIMKSVYVKRKISHLQGKALGQTYEKYKKIAEDYLNGEFAVALDIDKDQVPNYIETEISKL